MLTFNQIKITQNDAIQMQDTLLQAVKYTCDNNESNMYSKLVGSFHSILVKKNYLCITAQNGFREAIKKYNPDIFFNYLVAYIKWSKDPDLDKISIVDGKYQIDEALLLVLTERMCQNYLNHLLKNIKVNITEDEEVVYYQPDKLSGRISYHYLQPEEVVYYNPSNPCRKAIMNGTLDQAESTSFKFKGMFGASDKGRIRSNQEDAYYIGTHPANDDFKMMIVCDGVGGLDRGEVASNLVVKELVNWFENLDAEEFYSADNGLFRQILENKIRNIHQLLCRTTPGATTLCMSIIKKDCIMMINVGDSKGYIIDNNRFMYATKQEDFVHDSEQEMNIPKSLARFYKGSNFITNCLGGHETHLKSVNCQIIPMYHNHSYKIIICSDGVVDCLGDKKIVEIAKDKKYNDHAKALVEQALENTSYLKYELQQLGFFARRRVDISQYMSEIQPGKDNTTAVYGEVKIK